MPILSNITNIWFMRKKTVLHIDEEILLASKLHEDFEITVSVVEPGHLLLKSTGKLNLKPRKRKKVLYYGSKK